MSCCDLKGVEHAIEVTADSLYEAVIYVAGRVGSLGADAEVQDLSDDGRDLRCADVEADEVPLLTRHTASESSAITS